MISIKGTVHFLNENDNSGEVVKGYYRLLWLGTSLSGTGIRTFGCGGELEV